MATTDPEHVTSAKKSWVWIPRFRFYTVLVLTGLAMVAPIANFLKEGLKGDFWWVYVSGRWMAVHHRILAANPAAWNGPTLAGKTWVNLEWAWQLFIYTVNPHLHPLGYIVLLFIFELLMLAAFFWALKVVAPRLTAEARIGLYALYAIVAFPYTVKLRAELFSYVAFPVLLGILWRARDDRRWLWMLAPLTVIWANVHGSWLMIPALAALEALGVALKREWRHAGAVAAMGILVPLALAACLTPFHLRTLTYAWWLDHNHYINTYIQEWQSVNFHSATFMAFGAAVFAAWLWRGHIQVRYPALLDIWFIGITLAFFDQVRMITYFGMVFVLWLGYGLSRRPRFEEWLPDDGGRRSLRWAQAAGLVGALVVAVVIAARTEARWTAPLVPPRLVFWLNHTPHQVVLAPIDDGGYLEAHGVRDVFADGRSDFFLAHGSRFQDYVGLIVQQSARPSRVASIFARNQVDAILWPRDQMNNTLAWFVAAHHWRRAAVSGAWAVYMAPR